mmetsp:Transcript_23629/g.56054  ORF Transcript_23629/g.56054 Transcript_23629/m.56054 type:complete len:284 (-) Transcript_23629:33-884(-)
MAAMHGLHRRAVLLSTRRFAASANWEFTIAPYVDVPALGFERSDKFCMLTMKYPSFQGQSAAWCQEMYETKKKRRAEFIEELFVYYDDDKSGFLSKEQLQKALRDIGLAWDDGSIAGMLQRRDMDQNGVISQTEFPEVVKEAWGQIPTMTFSNKLGDLYKGDPLDGDRAVMFLGRTSPAGWVLRSVRNMCPYALRGCQILQNVCNNPEMNPEYMEAWMAEYHTGPVMTVEEVAEAAAASPTTVGSLCVRLDAVDKPDDGPGTVYVPIRGLPSNKQGFLSWLGF